MQHHHSNKSLCVLSLEWLKSLVYGRPCFSQHGFEVCLHCPLLALRFAYIVYYSLCLEFGMAQILGLRQTLLQPTWLWGLPTLSITGLEVCLHCLLLYCYNMGWILTFLFLRLQRKGPFSMVGILCKIFCFRKIHLGLPFSGTATWSNTSPDLWSTLSFPLLLLTILCLLIWMGHCSATCGGSGSSSLHLTPWWSDSIGWLLLVSEPVATSFEGGKCMHDRSLEHPWLHLMTDGVFLFLFSALLPPTL
jgi:hypothetical protein